jgi:hypothetical protein
VKSTSPAPFRAPARIILSGLFLLSLLIAGMRDARGDAMLELFQMRWNQITQKMPEIAEAGYDSLWLPNPAKGNSGAYSIGYDQFDPFDLGGTNQQRHHSEPGFHDILLRPESGAAKILRNRDGAVMPSPGKVS